MTNGIYSVQVKMCRYPKSQKNFTSIHLNNFGSRRSLLGTETIFLWSPSTPAEVSLIKIQLWGSCSWLPPVCSPLCCNANIQLSEENAIKKHKEKQHRNLVIVAELFSWLVSPPGLRSLWSMKMEIFRNYLWDHQCYQWALGNWQTKKSILNNFKTARYVVPKEAFAELTCMQVTRHTVEVDNHLGHVQFSCISKLKMGR